MTVTKRLAYILLAVVLVGTTACADSAGPQPETCNENQGTGGRCQ